MLAEIKSTNPNAPVIVLFGGNPARRYEVLQLLKGVGDITVYGTLSEEEGMEKLDSLPRVDLVLIGGRYSPEQRMRIKAYVASRRPSTKVTEPGYDYPYDNAAIQEDIRRKLGLKV